MKALARPLHSKKWEYLTVLFAFLLLSLLFTWPLVLHIHDALPGDNGIWEPTGDLGGDGDALQQTWVLAWNARTIFTHPSQLFQGNIIYPSRDVLAYSEHLFILGVMAAPVYWLARNPVLAYNLLFFLAYVLSAFGAYLLLKELTGSRWGGLAAGVFFAFAPFRLARTDHLWLVFSPFLPFMLLYLYRYLERGRRKDLALFGLFFLAQSLTSWHYLVFCAICSGLLLAWNAAVFRRRQDLARLAAGAAVMLAAVALTIPLALPYLRVHSRLPGFERTAQEISNFSAKPADFLRVLPQSVVYGSAPGPLRPSDAFRGAALFPGLVVIALALAGLFVRRREDDDLAAFDRGSFRRGALFFLVLAAVGLLLSFGPSIGRVSNPFYNLPYDLGILKFTRTPMRFFLLVVLGLAGLAGYGAARISARVSRWRGSMRAGRLVGAALVLLLLLETATFNMAVYPTPVWGDVPEVYDWLKEQGEARVIELPGPILGPGSEYYDRWTLGFLPEDPLEYSIRDGLSIYFSTYSWDKLVNGHSGYFPFFYRRIMTEMQAFPSRRSLDLLAGLRIDYVVWHWEWVEEEKLEYYREVLSSTPGLSLEGEFGEQAVYRLEAVETAGVEDISLSAVGPAAVPADEAFNLGLIARNDSGRPFVMAVEDPQPFRVRFVQEGRTVREEKGEYRSLFFLEPGEETSLPLVVEGTPPRGDYEMEVSLEGGALPDREFSLPLSCVSVEEAVGSGVLAGTLSFREEEVFIPAPDGLFSLVLEVENTGGNLWRSAWGKGVAEDYPYGIVGVGLIWLRDGEEVWERHLGLLPCDLSPGQAAQVPFLTRPPDQPGRYQLLVALVDELLDSPLSELASIEVEVRAVGSRPSKPI